MAKILKLVSKPAPVAAPQALSADDQHAIEAVQLKRLAETVLLKEPADLAALAQANPALVWEWIGAFAERRAAAESEARLWAAAAASLATSARAECLDAAE